jgi:hypothetical protein
MNLSHFTVPDMSQIKDFRLSGTSKVEKIYILYEPALKPQSLILLFADGFPLRPAPPGPSTPARARP